eukprot:4294950-Pleurochrysis_carterae.AAC.2
MVPTISLQLDSADAESTESVSGQTPRAEPSADVLLPRAAPQCWEARVLTAAAAVASGTLSPLALRLANTDLQIPRAGAISL